VSLLSKQEVCMNLFSLPPSLSLSISPSLSLSSPLPLSLFPYLSLSLSLSHYIPYRLKSFTDQSSVLLSNFHHHLLSYFSLNRFLLFLLSFFPLISPLHSVTSIRSA